jgi:hypothetical protein
MIEISPVLREEIAKVASTHPDHLKIALEARESALPGISAYILPDHADKSKILRLVTPGQNIAIALGAGAFLGTLASFFI